MITAFRNKIVLPLIRFLKQGTSPEKLAWSVTLGLSLGTVPILGGTTLLCGIAAVAFRLNMAAIQLINYFVYPLQLLLFIPFLKLGSLLYSKWHITYSITQVLAMAKENWWGTVKQLWLINTLGVLAWLVLAIPFSMVMYYSLLFVFRRFELKDRIVNNDG